MTLKKSFEKLYEKTKREVWAIGFIRLMNADLAMDIMQEAFLRLWEQLESDEIILHPRAWLVRVARNLAEDYARSAFRRHGTQPPEMMDAIALNQPSVVEALEDREDEEKIQQAFAALPAEYRELVHLHLTLTIAEIADKTGLTKRQIKRKLAKARTMLRRLLMEQPSPRRQMPAG